MARPAVQQQPMAPATGSSWSPSGSSRLPPTNLSWFFGWNLPYLLIPLALGWRMRRPEPFGV